MKFLKRIAKAVSAFLGCAMIFASPVAQVFAEGGGCISVYGSSKSIENRCFVIQHVPELAAYGVWLASGSSLKKYPTYYVIRDAGNENVFWFNKGRGVDGKNLYSIERHRDEYLLRAVGEVWDDRYLERPVLSSMKVTEASKTGITNLSEICDADGKIKFFVTRNTELRYAESYSIDATYGKVKYIVNMKHNKGEMSIPADIENTILLLLGTVLSDRCNLPQ